MNLNTEPIKNWFGFSRRERRSNFTLIIIILVITGIRYIIPDSRIQIEDITSAALASNIQPEEMSDDSSAKSGKVYKKYQGSNYSAVKNTFSVRTGQRNQDSGKYKIANRSKDKKYQVVDINNSDSANLVRLPGIGPVLASRIIKYRNLLGGFTSTGQLKEVYGLSEETYDLIKDRVTADTAFIKKININSAGYKEISHIRYLEKYEITSILKYKELKGRIRSMQDLIDNKVITAEKAAKVEGYLKFSD